MEGPKCIENNEKSILGLSRVPLSQSLPHWVIKMAPIWPQLGSPNGAKMAKKIDPKLDHFFMYLGIDVWAEFVGLAPKWDQILMFTWDGDFSKIVLWLQRGPDFSRFGGPSWEQKSIKERSKNGLQDEIHLSIDV